MSGTLEALTSGRADLAIGVGALGPAVAGFVYSLAGGGWGFGMALGGIGRMLSRAGEAQLFAFVDRNLEAGTLTVTVPSGETRTFGSCGTHAKN